jgi:predicted GTPase
MTTSADSGSTELELIRKELSTKSMILVMGITGAGKSSFINQLPLKSDKRARVGHTQGSCKYHRHSPETCPLKRQEVLQNARLSLLVLVEKM